jgi:hypothetical protein
VLGIGLAEETARSCRLGWKAVKRPGSVSLVPWSRRWLQEEVRYGWSRMIVHDACDLTLTVMFALVSRLHGVVANSEVG